MCGFAGFICARRNASDYSGALEQMKESIKHRGPDDDGTFIDDTVGLGFRRLSIIGIDNGKQPMTNEDGTVIVVYNGEIYNYQEIKDELISKGHIFRTDADTEVLVHGYEEFGTEILKRLRGMFAFAIWDSAIKQMFIARDFYGIKPLYYTSTDCGDFVFASEIKALHHFPGVKKEFNEDALESYLSFQYSVLDETFYKGIYRLMPGHFLLFKDGSIEIQRYWEFKFDVDETLSFDESVRMVDAVMANSIEAHKISDTEVGGFLSGGVDSSYIVARSNLDKTFTVGFDYPNCNEIPLAKTLSEYVGVKNYSKLITTDEFFEEYPKVCAHVDEPLSDPSSIALYFLCREASKQVKVILSGEGSDEMFGGYNIYRLPLDLAGIRKIPRPIRRFCSKVFMHFPKFRGRDLVIRSGQDVEERFIGNAYIYNTKEVAALMRNYSGKNNPLSLTGPFYDKVKSEDEISKMQYIDINFWLWGDILNKADTMSMAHSLEVRVPFLDMEVTKVAAKVPSKCRVTDKETKAYFRASAEKYMPDVSAERKKLGFPIPVRNWLREEYYYNFIKETLMSPVSEKFFNTGELKKLIDAHYAGHADNWRKIWTVYAFLIWYGQHFKAD